MKLLSMRSGGRNHAGIVVGDHVLDVVSYMKLREQRSQPDYYGEYAVSQKEEDPMLDGMDLFKRGLGWLRSLLGSFQIEASLVMELKELGVLHPINEITFNPPVLNPGKILAVGLNYFGHAAEQNVLPPEKPLVFSKCTTSLIANGQPIHIPSISKCVDYEGELAVIIGKEAKNVSADHAIDYIAGYTLLNDITARDIQKRERQWARAKGLDTFAPCGPWMVTTEEITDPHSLTLELSVNGEIRQSANTDSLIFKIPQLIEFISRDLTLRPGDIISTGTPVGVGVFRHPPVFLAPDDIVEVKVEEIGVLRNPVI